MADSGRFEKIPVWIWDDSRFESLSEPAKVAYLYLRTGPHNLGLKGLVRCPQSDLQDGCPREIESAGLAVWSGKWCLLPEQFIDNLPDTKNHLRGMVNRLADVPPNNPLRTSWRALVEKHAAVTLTSLKEDIEEPFGKPFSKPFSEHQEHDQDHKQEHEQEESCHAETGATSSMDNNSPDQELQIVMPASLVTKAHDLATARAEKRLAQVEVLEDWSNGLIKFVPETYQAYLPYLLAEFADLVTENRERKNQTFTVKRRADFARRMSKCQPLDQMLAMEIFVDRAPTADERYPAKIAETMKHYSDDEIGAERDKHRSRHPSGVWIQWKRDARQRAEEGR